MRPIMLSLGEPQHQLARNPPSVDECQSNVVLREESKNTVGNPTTMSEFNSDAEITGSPPDEIDQRRELARLEIGAHLDEYRSELLTQLPGSLEERLRSAGLVAESVLVGDLLGHL